jgi:hypothetical protein
MLTDHGQERVIERFPDLRNQIEASLARAERRFTHGNVAVRLAELPTPRGDTQHQWFAGENAACNGDTVWCIIRSGRIITVFTRRSKPNGRAPQPSTPQAMRVDAIVWTV